MIFFNRSRLPKTVKFDYKPRYYDPNKEESKRRMAERYAAKTGDIDGVKSRIARRMQSKRKVQQIRSRHTFRSNLILVAVLVALILLSGIFMEKFIEPMVQTFFNN
ncbi:MAG: hypothetical protein AAF598_08685 [Bacteroidota bacterium]